MMPTFGFVMMEHRPIPLQEGHHIAVLVPDSIHDGSAVVPEPHCL